MFVPRAREDECLILASDGLWDVMTNEEVCEVARRRILLWHKKNGAAASLADRGEGVDPAAQAAAEYLSKLAIQKGSKDNISVIVVDLKPHRRFKSKSWRGEVHLHCTIYISYWTTYDIVEYIVLFILFSCMDYGVYNVIRSIKEKGKGKERKEEYQDSFFLRLFS